MSVYGIDFRDRAAGKQKMTKITEVRHYKKDGEYINKFGIMGKGSQGQNLYTGATETEARTVSRKLGKRMVGKDMRSRPGSVSPKKATKKSSKKSSKKSPKKSTKKKSGSPKKSPRKKPKKSCAQIGREAAARCRLARGE
jgi:hypothetical protein